MKALKKSYSATHQQLQHSLVQLQALNGRPQQHEAQVYTRVSGAAAVHEQ